MTRRVTILNWSQPSRRHDTSRIASGETAAVQFRQNSPVAASGAAFSSKLRGRAIAEGHDPTLCIK